jgi:hypothetical protein
MDDKAFRKHLKDLAEGHHHPEEHDWAGEAKSPPAGPAAARKAGKAKSASKAPAKRKRESGGHSRK